MKKDLFIAAVFFVILTIGLGFVKLKHAAGFAGFTGSPSETTCANPGCHSGGSSIASGATISASPAFTSNTYVPGNTYTITVAVAAVGFTTFGFGCEILNSGNTNAGVMQNAGAGVQFMTAGNGRKNATQTAPKTGASNFALFSFEWVAPASGVVNLYAAGNNVNNNNNALGDLVVTTSLSVSAATSTSTGLSENSKRFSNLKIYPNPIVETVNLSYALTALSEVKMEIYNINGKLVSTLISEKQDVGIYNKTLRLPPSVGEGVYFLRSTVDGEMAAQRIISIK